MNKATELLKQAGSFFVSTMDGDQPRVRPFGAVAEIDGKTYICMNNQKNVFKQLMANPKVEICGMIEKKWFRLTGKVARDDSVEARAEMLNQNPGLTKVYKPDDGLYEVFYFTEVSGTLEAFGEPKETF